MVIPMCRRSPACRGVGADTPGVLQRTAELIPNQLGLDKQTFARLLVGNLRNRRLGYCRVGTREANVMTLCQRAGTPLGGDGFT